MLRVCMLSVAVLHASKSSIVFRLECARSTSHISSRQAVRVHVCMYVCTGMHVFMYVCVHTRMSDACADLYVCTYMCMYVCTYGYSCCDVLLCMHVCMYACTCMSCSNVLSLCNCIVWKRGVLDDAVHGDI